MRTARRYLAKEIYRSCAVILVALLGLFTFFALIEELDSVGEKLSLASLLYLQALALPTRLYDLLPIGLLIGAILALAGLAQRNELVILRVSGVSRLRMLGMLWIITVPLMAVALLLLSEFVTPAAEIKSGEANLMLLGKAGGGRLQSGYWFKEPTPGNGTRVLNVDKLLASGNLAGVTLYEFAPGQELLAMYQAETASFEDGNLILQSVTEHRISPEAGRSLEDASAPPQPLLTLQPLSQYVLQTTLTPDRLLARVLTPERMSLLTLWDYAQYLQSNQLQAERQIVAIWRKLAYPFTLLVMITIAAPIGFMQTRRGGVGAKVFAGILLGVGFFMVNQLALNVGQLSGWSPWMMALLPNTGAMLLGLLALVGMEHKHELGPLVQRRWPWRKAAA